MQKRNAKKVNSVKLTILIHRIKFINEERGIVIPFLN